MQQKTHRFSYWLQAETIYSARNYKSLKNGTIAQFPLKHSAQYLYDFEHFYSDILYLLIIALWFFKRPIEVQYQYELSE